MWAGGSEASTPSLTSSSRRWRAAPRSWMSAIERPEDISRSMNRLAHSSTVGNPLPVSWSIRVVLPHEGAPVITCQFVTSLNAVARSFSSAVTRSQRPFAAMAHVPNLQPDNRLLGTPHHPSHSTRLPGTIGHFGSRSWIRRAARGAFDREDAAVWSVD